MLLHCPGGIICPGLPVLWEIHISLCKKHGVSGQILLLQEHLPRQSSRNSRIAYKIWYKVWP